MVDDEVVQAGLSHIIEQHPGWMSAGERLAEVETGRTAGWKPEIVIVDYELSHGRAVDVIRNLVAADTSVGILAYSTSAGQHSVHEALGAGARGYLVKGCRAVEVVAAIQALLDGRHYFSSTVADLAIKQYLKADSDSAHQRKTDLSTREREVLTLLAEGKSNKQVASTLKISVRTVDGHRNNIMQKLGARSLTDLVKYAIRNGLVSL